MSQKTSVAYCRRCLEDTPHRRGRRCRWHCLACGGENLQLRPTGKIRRGFPPGFLLQEHADGQLGLYAMVPTLHGQHGLSKTAYYLKGVFPGITERSEMEDYAWKVHLALESETVTVQPASSARRLPSTST